MDRCGYPGAVDGFNGMPVYLHSPGMRKLSNACQKSSRVLAQHVPLIYGSL